MAPPSRRRAMWGCSRLAMIWRSRRNWRIMKSISRPRERSGCMGGLTANLPREPRLRGDPIALGSRDGHLQDFGGFFNGEAGEEAQLDEPALPLVDAGEPLERVIERHQVQTGAAGE